MALSTATRRLASIHLFLNPSLPHLYPSSSLPLSKTQTRSRISASMATSEPLQSKKVLVPVANGTEPMEAVIVIDVLRRSGAEVTVASVEKELRVDMSWGVKLVADALVKDCVDSRFDLLSLPGGMPGSTNFRDCKELEALARRQVEEGRSCSAICAAPAVALGPWGLLKGLKATCYPSFMEKLPSDAIAVESRVQVDGNIVTSRGPGTAMEFGVALVDLLYGKDKAAEVAGPLVMRPKHGEDFSMAELNPLEWKTSKTPQILVPIANGSEEMEAVMMIDVLRRAGANVTVASVEDKLDIVASRKVKLVADMLIGEAAKSQYDLMILPGGLPGAQAFANCEVLVNLLKKQAESKQLYGAICASPALVLESHGLLKGKKATAYPALCNKLSDASEAENRVVVDGNVVTSRGPGTTMEFALAIAEKFFGHQKALEAAKAMVFI